MISYRRITDPQRCSVIDRYARPAMKWVWSEENKNDKWLQVELAVCEAWAEEGTIPADDMAKLRMARYDPVRMMRGLSSARATI